MSTETTSSGQRETYVRSAASARRRTQAHLDAMPYDKLVAAWESMYATKTPRAQRTAEVFLAAIVRRREGVKK